jgi:hypothetical protein
MPSERTLRQQIGNQASTYHSRAIASNDEVKGRFEKEEASSVIGAGGAYPPARHPFSDDLNVVLNCAPDHFGVDLLSAPVVGAPHEYDCSTPDPNADLVALSDADLRAELNRLTSAGGPIRGAAKWDVACQAAENRRLAVEAEIQRRIFDYSAATDEALSHRKAWAQLAAKHAGLDVDKIEAAQAIVDRCEAEVRRRNERRF